MRFFDLLPNPAVDLPAQLRRATEPVRAFSPVATFAHHLRTDLESSILAADLVAQSRHQLESVLPHVDPPLARDAPTRQRRLQPLDSRQASYRAIVDGSHQAKANTALTRPADVARIPEHNSSSPCSVALDKEPGARRGISHEASPAVRATQLTDGPDSPVDAEGRLAWSDLPVHDEAAKSRSFDPTIRSASAAPVALPDVSVDSSRQSQAAAHATGRPNSPTRRISTPPSDHSLETIDWPHNVGRSAADMLDAGETAYRRTQQTQRRDGKYPIEIQNTFNIQVKSGAGNGEPHKVDLSEQITDILKRQALQHGIDIT